MISSKTAIQKIIGVLPLENRLLSVKFETGQIKFIDIAPYDIWEYGT